MKTNTATSDVNAVVLDYLTLAGYHNAAAKFCTEANLTPQQPYADIVVRQRIQRSIHQGDIEAAIEILNDLDPSVSVASHTSIQCHHVISL